MGKNPILSKWISPSKKTKKTHLPPPNNCTTYNAIQTKQSSPNLKSDILHFPECYGTSESMLDRQAGSCSSRKTKTKQKLNNKYLNVCRILIFFFFFFFMPLLSVWCHGSSKRGPFWQASRPLSPVGPFSSCRSFNIRFAGKNPKKVLASVK